MRRCVVGGPGCNPDWHRIVDDPWGWRGTIAWVAGASASLLPCLLSSRSLIRRGEVERSESRRRTSRAFVLDSCVQLGRNQALFGAFAFFVGWHGAGAMRLVVSLFGFVPVVVAGLVATALPQVAREGAAGRADPTAIMRHLRRVSVTVSSVGIVALLVLAGTPAPAAFLGTATWAAASPLLIGIALAHVAHALEAPLHVGVYGFAGPASVVRTKILAALVQICCTATGLAVFRASVAGTYAMAVGSIGGLIVWSFAWRRTNQMYTAHSMALESIIEAQVADTDFIDPRP